MDEFAPASTCLISTRIRHRVVTLDVREDALIFVRSGIKTLLGNAGPLAIGTGEAVVMARGAQWDVINDPATAGRYEALVLQFGDRAVKEFHERYAADFPLSPVDTCFSLRVAPELAQSLQRAADALASPEASPLVRDHRVLEVLLLLAERGCVLRPREALSWADRLRRLIGQRPHADWTVDALARSCHVSASTLRRRLADCDATVGGLLREIRLETAMQLLQTTALPVGEVAMRCGYDSHSRFSAAFRTRFGYAPSHLREEVAHSAQNLAQAG
jgi:AraC-like DNA-binding protein